MAKDKGKSCFQRSQSDLRPVPSALFLTSLVFWTTLRERQEQQRPPNSSWEQNVCWSRLSRFRTIWPTLSSQPPDSSQARTAKTKSKSGRVTGSTKTYTFGRTDQGNGEKGKAYPSAGKEKATTLLKSECIRSFQGLKVCKCLLVFPYLLLGESGKRRLTLIKHEPETKFSVLNYTSKLHLPQILCCFHQIYSRYFYTDKSIQEDTFLPGNCLFWWGTAVSQQNRAVERH